jgi:hypothetical protein
MARDVVVLSGYLVRCPLAGYAWQVLHYLLGLRAIGLDPYFYEDTAYYSDCFDPASGCLTDDPGTGVELAARFFGRHGLENRWFFEDTWRGRCFGTEAGQFREATARARLWITLAGVNRLPAPWRGRPGTVFIDIDPGYTQWQAAHGEDAFLQLLREHRLHFTIGENIGSPRCALATTGFDWKPTRQPIALSLWEPLPPDMAAPYTTVGRWDEQRREVQVDGIVYSWRKRLEWLKFLTLPEVTGQRFRIAMDVHKNTEDLDLLRRHVWEIADPIAVSLDPDVYRDFIRSSKGEFTVAKDLNVRLRTGWFSDRAACYLAAGRPVLNQDTGFADILPAGNGLHSFRTFADAVQAFSAIDSDYAGQCAAARRVAEQYFAPERVLSELVATAL